MTDLGIVDPDTDRLLAMADGFVQLSGDGTISLPAKILKELGLRDGHLLRVRVVEGSIQLTPPAGLPFELYTEERITEFLEAAEMTDEELDAARDVWGLPVEGR